MLIVYIIRNQINIQFSFVINEFKLSNKKSHFPLHKT